MGVYMGYAYFGLYGALVVEDFLNAALTGQGSISATVARIAVVEAALAGTGTIVAALLNVSAGDADTPEELRSTINTDAEVLTRIAYGRS